MTAQRCVDVDTFRLVFLVLSIALPLSTMSSAMTICDRWQKKFVGSTKTYTQLAEAIQPRRNVILSALAGNDLIQSAM